MALRAGTERDYVFVRDGFQRANGAVLGHTDTDDLWLYLNGCVIGTSSQKAVISVATSYGLCYASTAASDGLIDTIPQDFTSGRKVLAIAFRIQDASNFWFVANLTSAGAQSDSKISLWKRVAGVDTNVGGDAAFDWTDPKNIQLDLNGSAIKLWRARATAADTPLLSITDSAFSTATGHGIGTLDSNSNNTWQYWWFFEQPARSTADEPILVMDAGFGTSSKSSLIDVTKFVRLQDGIRTNRGMPDELGNTQAGTLAFTLDNQDQRFDPEFQGAIRNQVFNPSPQVNTTDYSAVSSTVTRDVAANIGIGAYGIKVVLTNVIGSGFKYTYANDANLTPGNTYWFSVSGFRATGSGSVNFRFKIDWKDSGGALLSTTTSGTRSFNSNNIRRLTAVGTAPASAHHCDVSVVTDVASGTDTYYFNALQFEESSAATDYCAGDQPNCRWSGTAYYSSSYYGGPYYPNVDVGKIVVARAFHDGQIPELIRAFAEDLVIDTPSKNDCVVRVSATDGIEEMAHRQVTASRSRELISDRIDYLLSLVGDITGLTDVSFTALYAQATYHYNSSVLQAIQEMVVTEGGRFFLDQSGRAIFLNHDDELASPYDTSQATFGDGGGSELPYTRLVGPARPKNAIRNDFLVQRLGGTEQTGSDATSQTNYGLRSMTVHTLGDADGDSADQVTWRKARYKDPHSTFTLLEFTPHNTAALWNEALNRELVDRITCKKRPIPGGTAISKLQQIIGIAHDIGGRGKWRVAFRLAPSYSD